MLGDSAMTVDEDKIDEAALALLHLTLHDGFRAWKNFDWTVLSRLHAKGFIENPENKTKSVEFSVDGLRESKRLFDALFKKA
jgi:hypothetical protein